MDRYTQASPERPLSVLFVCLGNICRSPAAQGVMEDMAKRADRASSYRLDSAGLYGGHAGEMPDRRMQIHARARGYSLMHRSRPVRESDFDNFDIIVAMDASNRRGLMDLAPTPEAQEKIVMMTDFCRSHPGADHVPDPYYEGAEGFELVLDLLEDACAGLLDATTPGHE
ncbi:MAG: low molecular weight phosphotyrosine protein phosphatase [Muribaculaceae bacterium]|nr:low molecular weight phosphotyrosine protein phosphatase [Muribaculaceae bacterium]